MTRNAVAVFGVFRDSEQHELELYEIAPQVGLSKQQVKAALEEMRAEGILKSRRESQRWIWSLAH